MGRICVLRSMCPWLGLVGRSSFSSVSEIYEQRLQVGHLKADEQQRKVIKLLDKLKTAVEAFPFGDLETTTETTPTRLRGVYLHGSVGAGKTMVMDLFYHACNIPAKRRVHFHQFMLEVHRRIHQHKQLLLRQHGQSPHIELHQSHDAIAHIAREISKEAKLLCFDEFQVTDICDAVILSRLFHGIWQGGTVIFATSNRPPADLYYNGLNRHDFLPFIERLQKECMVRGLDSEQDYRTSKLPSGRPTCFTPCTADTFNMLKARYEEDLAYWKANSNSLTIGEGREQGSVLRMAGGRTISLLAADHSNGFCMVDFHTLCKEDRGAVDYHALAAAFHSIYLYGVPRQSKADHNSARRFITLIDELYNAHVLLVWVADAEPMELFVNQPVELPHDAEAEAEDDGPSPTGSVDAAAVQVYQRSYQQSEPSIALSQCIANVPLQGK